MKFRFLVDMAGRQYIPAGTISELTPEAVEKYRGKYNSHLEGMDAESIEYLAGGVKEPEGLMKAELLKKAKTLEIKGAAAMTKEVLAAAIAEAKLAGAPASLE